MALSSNNLKVVPEKITLETDQGIIDSEEKKWGLPLKDVYKCGVSFYKDKEGKAIHLSYEDRLRLVAYTQQAAHGPIDVNAALPLGVLDVIGRDRRAAWLALGQMSHVQAMAGFVHTLDRLCPLFKAYVEAIQKDLEEKKSIEKRKEDDERAQIELHSRLQLEKQKQQSNNLTEEQQIRRIKDALNAQTYDQFLQYAQQQFPGNFDQQAILIRQLQDQHYHQYVQQLAVDQRLANSNVKQITEVADENSNVDDCGLLERKEHNSTIERIHLDSSTETKSMQTSEKAELSEYTHDDTRDDDSDGDGFPPVEEARMWTRGSVEAFKESARASGGQLAVGHGETITVRVPTHQHARCLCWEFATDNYDIGFGVYFEWSKSPSTEVTIHVSESDEEDDETNDGDEEYITDPELGTHLRETSALATLKAPVSIVVPIYRRDCHTEVYAGSHTYPGEGVYLLKFDNTYSVWRSKSLYYKVYYTQ